MGRFVRCPEFVTHLEGENINSKKCPTFQESVPHYMFHIVPQGSFQAGAWEEAAAGCRGDIKAHNPDLMTLGDSDATIPYTALHHNTLHCTTQQ